MFGRGEWLYKQLERELAWERAQQKALDTCRSGCNAALITPPYGATLIPAGDYTEVDGHIFRN